MYYPDKRENIENITIIMDWKLLLIMCGGLFSCCFISFRIEFSTNDKLGKMLFKGISYCRLFFGLSNNYLACSVTVYFISDCEEHSYLLLQFVDLQQTFLFNSLDYTPY